MRPPAPDSAPPVAAERLSGLARFVRRHWVLAAVVAVFVAATAFLVQDERPAYQVEASLTVTKPQGSSLPDARVVRPARGALVSALAAQEASRLLGGDPDPATIRARTSIEADMVGWTGLTMRWTGPSAAAAEQLADASVLTGLPLALKAMPAGSSISLVGHLPAARRLGPPLTAYGLVLLLAAGLGALAAIAARGRADGARRRDAGRGRRVALVAGSAAPLVGAAAALVLGANPPLAAVTTALAAAVWFAWLAVRRELRPVRMRLLVPGVVVTIAAMGSLIVAEQAGKFSLDLALAPVAAGLVASLACDRAARRFALIGLSALVGLFGFLSLARYGMGAGGGSTVLIDGRLVARNFLPGFGHPNQYAAALVLLLPFPVAAGLAARRWIPRLAYTSAVLLGLGALALTYSRGFFVAFVASCLVFLVSRSARRVLAGAAVVLAAVAGPLLAGRFLSGSVGDNVRMEIWGRALRMIADHPLLGVGVGNFSLHAQDVTLPRSAAPPPHAHDVALVAATEIGVPGALALIGAIVVLAVALVRALPKLRGTDRQVALACCAAIVATAVGGAFDAMFIGNVQTLLVAATVAGLAAAVTALRPTPLPGGAPGPEVAAAREPAAAAAC